MGLYRQSPTGPYWYEFVFKGIRYRSSTETLNKQIAQQIENKRREDLIKGINQIQTTTTFLTFSAAVATFVADKQIEWAKNTQHMHKTSLPKLLPHFGPLILQEIKPQDIRNYQQLRKTQVSGKTKEVPSNRTINVEVGLVRQVLTEHKLWLRMMEGTTVKASMRVRKDVGRELTDDECTRLLRACMNNVSIAIYPAVLLSIYTGIRNHELRGLRWNQIDFDKRMLTVGKSKTDAGAGRKVNLNDSAIQILRNWKQRIQTYTGPSKQHHFVFPHQRYGLLGGPQGRTLQQHVGILETCPEKPVGSFHGSWRTVRTVAGVECRWHDLRHTCASRLAASGAMDQTLTALLGWMSPKMIEHYSHVRAEAKKEAMDSAFKGFHVPTINDAVEGSIQ